MYAEGKDEGSGFKGTRDKISTDDRKSYDGVGVRERDPGHLSERSPQSRGHDGMFTIPREGRGARGYIVMSPARQISTKVSRRMASSVVGASVALGEVG